MIEIPPIPGRNLTKRLDLIEENCIGSTKKLASQLERIKREKNLIVKGLTEANGETNRSLAQVAKDLFTSSGVADVLIDNAFRLGNPMTGRPRIAKIMLVRDEILRKKGALGAGGGTIYIDPDLSPEEQRIKKKLLDVFRGAKQKDAGVKMRIRGNRLLIMKDAMQIAAYAYNPHTDDVTQELGWGPMDKLYSTFIQHHSNNNNLNLRIIFWKGRIHRRAQYNQPNEP